MTRTVNELKALYDEHQACRSWMTNLRYADQDMSLRYGSYGEVRLLCEDILPLVEARKVALEQILDAHGVDHVK